jgi:2-phosphoglycerate kinase
LSNWLVLLISGCSSTGKTTLARQIAAYYAAECVQVDDFRLVMQRVTTPATHPDLHYLVDPSRAEERDTLNADQMAERLRRIGEIVSKALEVVIAHHLSTMRPIVIEGDGIIPALARQQQFESVTLMQPGRLRFVLLDEPDEANILKRLLARGRGLHSAPEQTQNQAAHTAWRYGQWLRAEAERLRLPIIVSSPYDTLIERVLKTLK